MNKILLAGLVLACGVGCGASTLLGKADGGGCGVTYPETGFYGPNILYPGVTSFADHDWSAPPYYELVASHPFGATVKVNMTLLWGLGFDPGGPAFDWRMLQDPTVPANETFQTPDVAAVSESTIAFFESGQARLDIFECGATTPTSSKTISWASTAADAGPRDGSVGDDAARDAGGLVFPPLIGIPGFDAGTGNSQD